MASKITNTAAQSRTVIDMIPGTIQASERRGQEELVNSSQLPAKIRPVEGMVKLEEAGVVFKEVSKGDSLFLDVTLPVGWKIKRTDHSMWTSLVDDKNVERASIFYKAAFYDRDAFMTVLKEPKKP